MKSKQKERVGGAGFEHGHKSRLKSTSCDKNILAHCSTVGIDLMIKKINMIK